MTFEYEDYLYLAQELAGKTPAKPSGEAAKLRSAISRAYYAAFLKAREYLENNSSAIIPRDGTAHSFVRDEFLFDRDGKRKRIGRYLGFLLENRRLADYEETLTGLPNLTEVAVERAGNIIQWLAELR